MAPTTRRLHQEVTRGSRTRAAAGKPITVVGEPGQPSESVFDREMRWKDRIPDPVRARSRRAFGRSWGAGRWSSSRSKGEGGAQAAVDRATSRRGANGQANARRIPVFFAFMWNASPFPLAFPRHPRHRRAGEWWGSWCSLPAVGIGLLCGPVSATWAACSRAAERARRPRPPSRRQRARPVRPQAARAMFDPQAPPRAGWARVPPGAEADIPPSIAESRTRGTLTLPTRHGGRLGCDRASAHRIDSFPDRQGASTSATTGYSGRGEGRDRRLLDVSAVALFVGNLVVTSRRASLPSNSDPLRRKSWRLRREAIPLPPATCRTRRTACPTTPCMPTPWPSACRGQIAQGRRRGRCRFARASRARWPPPSITRPRRRGPLSIPD